MRFIRLSLLTLMLAVNAARANEGGEGGEGGGEGKGAAPPRDQREYTEKTTKLATLGTKIEESAKHFAEVAKEKEEARGDARTAALKEMVEIARQRQKDEAEYARLKAEIAQRYPNRGEPGHRGDGHEGHHAPAASEGEGEHAAAAHGSPAHGEAAGGEAHEAHAAAEGHGGETAATGLDEVMKRTKAAIDQKYAPFLPPKITESGQRGPASDGAASKRPRLRLER